MACPPSTHRNVAGTARKHAPLPALRAAIVLQFAARFSAPRSDSAKIV
jgi:hypothetical protein